MRAAELITEMLPHVAELTIAPDDRPGEVYVLFTRRDYAKDFEFRGTLMDALTRAHAVAITPVAEE